MTEIPYEENPMAAAATRTRRTAAKPKAAAPVEPEVDPTEDFDEELVEEEGTDDLEEMDEDEVAESKPATKKSAVAEVTFGIRDLVDLIKRETGETTDPRSLRTLIRKMAREDKPRVDREITPGNRTRYDWSGPNDPEVLAIVAAYKGGELEAEKQAKLAKLKADKAAKTAQKKAAAVEAEDDGDDEPAKPARRTAAKKTTTRRKTTAKPAPVEEVEDDEELDFDEE